MADKQIQTLEEAIKDLAHNTLKDSVIIIKNGRPTLIKSKQHGHDTIIWKNGQVLDIDRSERIRIDGQEVI